MKNTGKEKPINKPTCRLRDMGTTGLLHYVNTAPRKARRLRIGQVMKAIKDRPEAYRQRLHFAMAYNKPFKMAVNK